MRVFLLLAILIAGCADNCTVDHPCNTVSSANGGGPFDAMLAGARAQNAAIIVQPIGNGNYAVWP